MNKTKIAQNILDDLYGMFLQPLTEDWDRQLKAKALTIIEKHLSFLSGDYVILSEEENEVLERQHFENLFGKDERKTK